MTDIQTKQMLQLLQTASDRQRNASDETVAFNLLAALHMEHYETQTHSRIIFFLLNSGQRENIFLHLFLQTLNVPHAFLAEHWNVYREKSVNGGSNRMDFVIESQSFLAIIEMKINAGDGDAQLARYAAYGRKKRKEYRIYYLTPDGRKPEEQSAEGIEENKLVCISFEREIVSWLQACMKTVKKGGYKYSFLKQYLGAVKHITGTYEEDVSVADLLDSSEMARAAKIVMDSFKEKMNDVTEQFFKKLSSLIRKKAKVKTLYYSNAVDVFLETFTYRKHTYHVILELSIVDLNELVILFGFSKENEEGDFPYLLLDEAESLFPAIYRKWIGKLESLNNLPKIGKWKRTRWFYAEDAQGAQMNFHDYSAQIKLIDEMNLQCSYITDNLVNLVIKPLLS